MTKKLAEWASEHDQIIKSGLSWGHQEKSPSVNKCCSFTINSELKAIWEMSVEEPLAQNHHRNMGHDNLVLNAQNRFLTTD